MSEETVRPRPPRLVLGLDLGTSNLRVCYAEYDMRGSLMRNVKLEFYAGQYVNLTVPDTSHVRAYSMASPPEEPASLEFLVRLVQPVSRLFSPTRLS